MIKKKLLLLLVASLLSMNVINCMEMQEESDDEKQEYEKIHERKLEKLKKAGLWKILNQGGRPIRIEITNTPLGKKVNSDRSFVLAPKESIKLNLATLDNEFNMYMLDIDKDSSLMFRILEKESLLKQEEIYPQYPEWHIDANEMDIVLLMRIIAMEKKVDNV